MDRRALGTTDIKVPRLGLGCMGMSEFYGEADEAESLKTIDRALELGINLFDTADMYGRGANEQLLARAFRGRRAKAILATKFGIVRREDGTFAGVNGRPEYARACCDASLKRLATDYIDLYYLHRVDPHVPIEETVGAMGELVEMGKVRCIGLSGAPAAVLRKAARQHPIAALQTEYSLWSRDCEGDILATCRELNITFVAYSPLGRGFLTGTIQHAGDLSPDDWRRKNPRFREDALEHNRALADLVEHLARDKGCAPAQLALAWVLAQGDDIVPIPGTKRRAYLEQNVDALRVSLSPDDLAYIQDALARITVEGARY